MREADSTTHCLIIGGGPAAYTAAVYAARANLNPLVVEGPQPGGQLMITTDVENWPGDRNVQGPDLMSRMQEHVRAVGAEHVSDVIQSVDFTRRPYKAVGESGVTYKADTVVVATGAKARWLGVKGESEFMGRGVSACATCDGFFYKNRDVAVVGGGNTAVEEALYLSGVANRVYLVHRRDELRAERILQDRLFAKSNVTPLWNRRVKEIVGDATGVTGAVLVGEDGSEESLDCFGVFVAIGHDPATGFLGDAIMTDSKGYIGESPMAPNLSVFTEKPGVFAAGDVIDRTYQQAVTASAMGCMAALESERFLAENGSALRKACRKA